MKGLQEIHELPGPPSRAADAHKGNFGRVLVVAGAMGYAGAADLAALGCLRSGAGLVSIFVPGNIYQVVASACPALMTHPSRTSLDFFRPGALGEIEPLLEKTDVLAVGPGLGRTEETGEFVRSLLETAREIAVVLDADGLYAVREDLSVVATRSAQAVLTPHPGELSYLSGRTIVDIQSDRPGAAADLARRSRGIALLKGAGTVVTDGERYYVNTTGNPGMATAGTGDVLTGMIAALMAQGMKPFEAAALGAHLHGLAGDLAAEDLGQHSLISTDLIGYLGEAFLQHGRAKHPET